MQPSMKIQFLSVLGLASFGVTTVAHAMDLDNGMSVRPVVTASIGMNNAKPGEDQTVNIAGIGTNYYPVDRDLQHKLMAGIFGGAEVDFNPEFMLQLGVGYYHVNPFSVSGQVLQNGLFNAANYNYKVRLQRIMFETRAMTTMWDVVHPYVVGSIGDGMNRAYNYAESGPSTDLPFADKTMNSLALGIGTGLQVDVTNHFRIGAGYQFVDMGKARLGVSSSSQTSQDYLSAGNLYGHEVSLQLSLVG